MKLYADMRTEELQALLLGDFSRPVDERRSYEELQPILEELVSRKEPMETSVEKAWEEFVKYYRPAI